MLIVAMFADDVFVCLGEQEGLFNKLMSTSTDFGYLSGYKVNILNTKIMTLNFTVLSSSHKNFKVNWENEKHKIFRYMSDQGSDQGSLG